MTADLRTPKLIATDIDGTMLRSDGTLSPRVRDALHAATDAGITVLPATGRPYRVAENVIDALGLGGTWIFANGAMTRDLDGDRLIRGFWMDPEPTSDLVIDLRKHRPGLTFGIEFETGLAFEDPLGEVIHLDNGDLVVADVADAVVEVAGSGARVQKVLVSEPGCDPAELYDAVVGLIGDRAVVTRSGLSFLELSAEAVTKATALEMVSTDIGIDRVDIAAFGDNHNDISMLEWAGRGYAMANATTEAKRAADHLIGHNDEDGLALAIEAMIGPT